MRFIHYNAVDMINCVRWSPSGDMLSRAFESGATELLDFKTGKILYSAVSSSGKFLKIKSSMFVERLGIPQSVCFI